MYIVYSIQDDTSELKLHDYADSENSAKEVLEKVALDFLVYEEGKRRARILEGLPIVHDEIDKGYLLHRVDSVVDKIDVYYKSQHIRTGWIGTSVEYSVKKVMFFGIVEFNMSYPKNVNVCAVAKKAKAGQQRDTHNALISEFHKELVSAGGIEQLRNKLKKRAQKCEDVYDPNKDDVLIVNKED